MEMPEKIFAKRYDLTPEGGHYSTSQMDNSMKYIRADLCPQRIEIKGGGEMPGEEFDRERLEAFAETEYPESDYARRAFVQGYLMRMNNVSLTHLPQTGEEAERLTRVPKAVREDKPIGLDSQGKVNSGVESREVQTEEEISDAVDSIWAEYRRKFSPHAGATINLKDAMRVAYLAGRNSNKEGKK